MTNKEFFKRRKYRVKHWRGKYQKFLDNHNLQADSFNYALITSKKNHLLKNMNYLIQAANLRADDYIDNMNLIRLLSSELYFVSSNTLDAETMIQLNERVDDILQNLNLVLISDNLEQDLLRDFEFTPEETTKYFHYNRLYSILATAFAAPFILNDNYYLYYRYAYCLTMYLNLHYFSNRETINPDPRFFLVKLKVQQEMIQAIKKISPSAFNTFIARTNKWISKINFKKIETEEN